MIHRPIQLDFGMCKPSLAVQIQSQGYEIIPEQYSRLKRIQQFRADLMRMMVFSYITEGEADKVIHRMKNDIYRYCIRKKETDEN